MVWTFYWLDGTRQVLPGESAHDALNLAGYGRGALRALDFYAEGDDTEWDWNPDTRNWEKARGANNAP